MFSASVPAKTYASCGMSTRRPGSDAGGYCVMEIPSRRTSPAAGRSIPASSPTRLDLPTPLGPTIAR
jgi:hypothetical protein